MDGQKGLVLWIAGAAGSLLLYSAFKNKHPLAVLTAGVAKTNTAAPAAPIPSPTGAHKDAPVEDITDITPTVPAAYKGYARNFLPMGAS